MFAPENIHVGPRQWGAQQAYDRAHGVQARKEVPHAWHVASEREVEIVPGPENLAICKTVGFANGHIHGNSQLKLFLSPGHAKRP